MKHLVIASVRSLSATFVAVTWAGIAAAQLPVPSTSLDFKQPGTQPLTLNTSIIESSACQGCHSGYNPTMEPYSLWAASMMGQAGRDPVFYAALAIANQDANGVGEYCLRCHAPGAWLDGRCLPADGSGLVPGLGDLDGVTCNLCHRMVDPVVDPVNNPPTDLAILQALVTSGDMPVTPSNAQYIIDPDDVRRGPFDLGPSFFYHEWKQSPFHLDSQLCGNCHEVSNHMTRRAADLSYDIDPLNQPHATQNKRDEFPIERTYSEWSVSQYARGPVETADAQYPTGRFGGSFSAVASCQDCHMPKTTGIACQPVLGPVTRPDFPLHYFTGVNSWVLGAVRAAYPDSQTGLSASSVTNSYLRMVDFQQRATDLDVWATGGQLGVRVVNQTGHKIPSGYNEGRRMWVNVKFFDASNALIAERGAYDAATATLTTGDTKVYEASFGIDADMSAATGLPVGESFHFVLNNQVFHDNRIPPRGFTNYKFTRVQAEPVGASYAEEQYWDDTYYAIPPGAVSATVTTFHQTSSREYMEFLRDTNTTNGAGLTAYNAWVAQGKSAPVQKRTKTLSLTGLACAEPIAFGVAKTMSIGGQPELGWTGSPSLALNNFQLTLTNARPDATGVVSMSPVSASTPFHGGTLYLGGTITRIASFQNDLAGTSTVSVPVLPTMVGTGLNYQAFFRDPGSIDSYGITNAVHVVFCD